MYTLLKLLILTEYMDYNTKWRRKTQWANWVQVERWSEKKNTQILLGKG